jgi:hypothetical protein
MAKDFTCESAFVSMIAMILDRIRTFYAWFITRRDTFWEAANTLVALAALVFSLINFRFQKRLLHPRYSFRCRLEQVKRDSNSFYRLRILFQNNGPVPIELADLGLEVLGQPELLKCKWSDDRTILPKLLT